MLAAETSALEASAAWDNTTLRVKYAEFQATLVEQEVLERMSRAEVENTTVLASAREDVEGLVRKIALLEGELVVEHWAWEVSKRERWEQFKELKLLHTWGSELCHTVVGPSRVRHHLSKGIQLAALRHTEMEGELATLRPAVSFAVKSVLGRSPSDTFRVEVVGELAVKF
jgi:hypothetical protein